MRIHHRRLFFPTMNFDYCLETSFKSASRSPCLSRDVNAEPRTKSTSPNFEPRMDLNEITREYEKYKRKLSDERMMDLREILRWPQAAPSTGSEDTASTTQEDVPALPLESVRTITSYEMRLRDRSRSF